MTIPSKEDKKRTMNIPTIEEFKQYIRDHLARTGESPTSFGTRVMKDAGGMSRLLKEDGTDPRLSTMRKIDKAIKNATRT